VTLVADMPLYDAGAIIHTTEQIAAVAKALGAFLVGWVFFSTNGG
jgi:hypothetical protein